jgi:hypothetical protein
VAKKKCYGFIEKRLRALIDIYRCVERVLYIHIQGIQVKVKVKVKVKIALEQAKKTQRGVAA